MIGWMKEYEIGINIIDDEHREIIEAFEKLYNLMRDGKGHKYYNELIDFLEKYITDHFEHEEKFQESIDYPRIDEHKKAHEDFRHRVNNLRNKYKGVDVTNYELIQINLMVKDWLVKHILVEDMKLGKYYKDHHTK